MNGYMKPHLLAILCCALALTCDTFAAENNSALFGKTADTVSEPSKEKLSKPNKILAKARHGKASWMKIQKCFSEHYEEYEDGISPSSDIARVLTQRCFFYIQQYREYSSLPEDCYHVPPEKMYLDVKCIKKITRHHKVDDEDIVDAMKFVLSKRVNKK